MKSIADAFTPVEMPVSKVSVGDFVEFPDWPPNRNYGEVRKITEHGRTIGDGTVDWYTFQVIIHDHITDRADHYTTSVGPKRATDIIKNWSVVS